ncbi:hypothetical protein Patl1_18845 [Pistacia atlantica]|uniref:Uncharacterized protein n=1 Tax=Pistacia atlantica TaxID=434234 RepID=A0ACC1C210_9ROSI|nr:hypothetical protein Patl1_18845 [Pistacia atlantica]
MVQKRPFEDEETLGVSSKHPKQVEHGEGGYIQNNTQADEKLASDDITERQASAEDVESSGPGCTSISSGPTSGTSEEDSHPGTLVFVPVCSEYFNPERALLTGDHPRDVYSFLMNHPPRKSVPIGQNHQADIPAWGSQYAEVEDERVRMGTCIIPMTDSSPPDFYGRAGIGRSDCHCEDLGSIRCVKQHIIEARQELEIYLGKEKLVELGFHDMGEVVANNWSNGEEQMFHKIVYSNPASLGRNFWSILSAVFPSRRKSEIVSYYFNVFMLQKRAEQNRCYPLNISSDNDEWQGSDDYGGNETGMSADDDDDDSVIESPAYHPDMHYQSHEDDLRIYEEDAKVYYITRSNDENTDSVCDGITNNSEAYPGKLSNACDSTPSSKFQINIPGDEKGDREVQDESCTSSDTAAAAKGPRVKSDKDGYWPGNFNEMSNGGGHEYVLESCDAKVWDGGYTSCHQNKVDLLPTCSMIEEVFGDGSWNFKVRDGKA